MGVVIDAQLLTRVAASFWSVVLCVLPLSVSYLTFEDKLAPTVHVVNDTCWNLTTQESAIIAAFRLSTQ